MKRSPMSNGHIHYASDIRALWITNYIRYRHIQRSFTRWPVIPSNLSIRCCLALTLSNFIARIALQVLDLVGIGSHPHPMDAIANETFHNFIASTITVSKTKVSVILVASLYLRRCKSQFDVTAFGQLWLKERVFIAAIALAYKVSWID